MSEWKYYDYIFYPSMGIVFVSIAVVFLLQLYITIVTSLIQYGTIEDKQFIAAHYETKTETKCIRDNNGDSTCFTYDYQVYVPDSWFFKICKPKMEDFWKDLTRCNTVKVTERAFNRYQIGDDFSTK